MSDAIDVLVHQIEFIESTATHTGLIGGLGSGKTYAGILKTVIKKLQYVGMPVAYYLPTYGLIDDIAIPKFEEMLTRLKVPFETNKSKHFIITAYGKIIMRSMSNPERIVGYEVAYSLIDETDLLSVEDMTLAFSKIIGRNRLRLPNNEVNKTDVVGTPEGFKWAYNFFVKEKKANRIIIKGKTKDNPFLPESYIETLYDTYTPQQLEAYLDGEFVNLTSGNVYNHYDRVVNDTKRRAQPNDVLHVGMDFNITKMNAVIHVKETHRIIAGGGSSEITEVTKRYAVDEVVNAYDTAQLSTILRERYPNHQIVIYPDASGDNRKSSGKSDIEILKEHKFLIKKPAKNPYVKDRVNAVNQAFKSSKNITTYFVNQDTCPSYTEALERQTYKNGEPDKTSGFDHINEAGGYFIYYDSKVKGEWGKSRT